MTVDAKKQETFTEKTLAEAVQNCTNAAIQMEAQSRALLSKGRENGGRPTLIAMPGQPSVTLNGPSPAEVMHAILANLVVLHQTTRITLLALNDLDTRLRQQTAPSEVLS